MEGRVNLNAPFTGRTTDTTEEYTEDVVYTRRTVYRRASVLKFFPATSPAEGVAVRGATKLMLGLLPPDVTLWMLAAAETAIGLGLGLVTQSCCAWL
ncbi:hypothetical protein SFUMM280S_04730 [Streptomyces fumanus]